MWWLEFEHIEAHKTTHVSWFERGDFCSESSSVKTQKPAADCCYSHRCCVWHSTPQSSVATWGQNTQIWVKALRTDQRGLWWELHLQNETQHFGAHIWQIAEQVYSNVGIELVRVVDTDLNMLVFYHQPSLLGPLLLFPAPPPTHTHPFSSSSLVVRNPLLTVLAVCLLFISNVSVAGSPHKATSIDWKTIQFSLARLVARCGLDLCFF